MDDLIDLRTQLIYASLQDDDLVRQLQEARSAARSDRPGSGTAPDRSTGGLAGRHRRTGTRPWVTAAGSRQAARNPRPDDLRADDLMDADVTSSGRHAFVVDVRQPQSPRVTVDVDAPTAATLVVQQRSSEWAGDDPSYYLG